MKRIKNNLDFVLGIKLLTVLLSVLVSILILNSCNIYKGLDRSTNEVNKPESFSFYSDSISDTIQYDLSYSNYFKDTNLLKLIDEVISSNFDLKKAIQIIEISKANFNSRSLAWLPSFNFTSGAGVRRYGEYTIDGVGNFDTNLSPNISGNKITPNPVPDYLLGVESSWEIDVWGKIKNKKKSALNNYLANEEAKNNLKIIIVSEIASKYYRLVSLKTKLDILEQNTRLQERVLELVKVQKMAGNVNELAVKQIQAQLLNTKSFTNIIQKQVIDINTDINMLSGSYFGNIIIDSSLQNELLSSFDFSKGIPVRLLQNRPDVKQKELNLLKTNADVRAIKAAFYPSFSISPFGGVQAFRSAVLLSFPASLAYNLPLSIAQPIFTRGQLKNQFKISKSKQLIAFYEYEQTLVNAFLEVENLLNNLTIIEEAIKLKKQEVQVLKEAVEISKILFVSGKATYIEVVTTQRAVLDEDINLMKLQNEENNLKIALFKAIGGGI